jgi:exopolysaccharide biosynthesis protein
MAVYGLGFATWTSTFQSGLPQYMQQEKKIQITIANAMMLDGGGSTSFGYRWRDKQGNDVQEPVYVNTTREIPPIVQTWAESP